MYSPSPRLSAWLMLIETLLATTVHAASLPQREYAQVLRSKPDIVHGETLFETCAACHGPQGAGIADGTVPAIAGQHFHIIARQLVEYRHDKRWDLRMNHFTDQHHLGGAQDIADLAAFISKLTVSEATDHGSGEYLRHGGEVYAHLCASCHGAAGEGGDRERYPRLAGQHYDYLLRQMHDGLEGRRPNFPPSHVRLLQRVERVDLAGLADYLSRL